MPKIREIVLDTETTGFDPFKNRDRLVEIGCVELIDHIPTGETYHQYINPQRDMPEGAFKVHGLSTEFLSDKPLFTEIATAFLAFIGDSPLIIHNAPFDMKFLNAELEWAGRQLLPANRAIDTLALARQKFPGSPNTLDALCKRLGVSNARRTLHGALLDSEILAEVYLELIGGRQVTLGLAPPPKQTTLKVENTVETTPSTRPRPLSSRLTAVEAEAHEAFVAAFGGTEAWAAAVAAKS